MKNYLESCGIPAERKSLYDDIDTLRESGLDIVSEKRDRNVWYHVVSREFELSELKLLVDAVLGSRFITERKSAELIRKLESLCSRFDAYALDRQLTVAGRIKSMNESIYYNVDKIHTAIRDNTRITFRYFDYNVRKERVYRTAARCMRSVRLRCAGTTRTIIWSLMTERMARYGIIASIK